MTQHQIETLRLLHCPDHHIALFHWSENSDGHSSMLFYSEHHERYGITTKDRHQNSITLIFAESMDPPEPKANKNPSDLLTHVIPLVAMTNAELLMPDLSAELFRLNNTPLPKIQPDSFEDNDGEPDDWHTLDEQIDPTGMALQIHYSSIRSTYRVAVSQNETTLCKKFSRQGAIPRFGMDLPDSIQAYQYAEALAHMMDTDPNPTPTKPPSLHL